MFSVEIQGNVCYYHCSKSKEGDSVMQKLLIADASEEFCETLSEIVGDSFDIRLCSEGNRALELMKSFQPDIVFLDMSLPGLDGIAILEATISAGINPVVLAGVSHFSDYMCISLSKLGVAFAIRRPYAPAMVADRLADIYEESNRIHVNVSMAEDPIGAVLAEMGFRTKRSGYACLCAALEIAWKEPGQAITKSIYPAVAAKCGGTHTRVEKAIRDAIRQAWNNRNNRIWHRYFPAHCGRNECPKNNEFLTEVAFYLIQGEHYAEVSGK